MDRHRFQIQRIVPLASALAIGVFVLIYLVRDPERIRSVDSSTPSAAIGEFDIASLPGVDSEEARNEAAEEPVSAASPALSAPSQTPSQTRSKRRAGPPQVRSGYRVRISQDSTLGAAAMVIPPGGTPDPEARALVALRSFSLAPEEGEPEFVEEDVADLRVTGRHQSQHNGVSHVYLRQRFGDLEVYGADANVNLAADGTVLSAHNGFVPGIRDQVNSSDPQLTAEEAVRSATNYLEIEWSQPLAAIERRGGASRETIFEGGDVSRDPIPAKLMYLPIAKGETRLVWNTVLHLPDGSEWLDMNVDATTGEVLSEANWVAHAGYRVFGLPLENPDDGSRSLQTDPEDAIASPHGWHDTNGSDGAEYTNTRGNNVFAQEDEDADNTGGRRAEGGAGLSFDFPLDLNTSPESYRDASLTNLFYWNNLLHDLHYRYGFDEASGNFQHNNYGRGGIAGDALQADSLDGSGTNNANFATPPDGTRPRMQMFLWTGVEGGVTVDSPASISGDYDTIPAEFGPMLSASVSGALVLADDGSANPTRACFPLVNPTVMAGKIALIDRGGCNFVTKVKHAQDAGAVAVIVANNQPGSNLLRMTGTDSTIVIPSFFLSYEDGQILRAQIGSGVTMTLRAQIDRDSSLDNLVIIHEYGHGVSNRLTGGAANSSALSAPQSRGMGEGWSDWWGLVLTAKPEDTATTWRAVGNYLLGQDENGDGIRPAPYTTDFAKNSLTYGDLVTGELSVPHGIGTVWCSALWEVYWNLVAAHGFDSDFYTGSGGNNLALQLVMDGLKLQPANPSFLDARDAILLADRVNNAGANQEILWQAFAKRGMGFSAYDGGSASSLEVVESFDLPDDLEITPMARDPFLTSGAPGGPFTPALRTYTLENTGTASLDWDASSGAAWVTVNPTSGTLAAGASIPVEVTIAAAATTLPLGTVDGLVTFRNLTSGNDQGRAVSLSVNELAESLDTSGISWYTGAPPWFPQGVVTHDGVDAAQSGEITHDQVSTMRTEVAGPDTLIFWWKVSSEEYFDYLELRIDGEIEKAISGEVEWTQVSVEIPAGAHEVEWNYRKDYSVDAGVDAGWVDQVRLVALDSPVITSRGQADGLGGKPFAYQIEATASPTSFTSDPLPAGLLLDGVTGLISGVPLAADNQFITVTATNAFGSGSQEVEIRIRDIAPFPFTEGFESGGLSDYWLGGGTNRARNTVTQDYGPAEGNWHFTMDSSAVENSRNELTVAADLSGASDLLLIFRAREFGDESHGPPPVPFTGGADFDGVAISEDGIDWYEVKPLRGAIRGSYGLFAVELDHEIARHGLVYNDAFRIRFNHFDNEPIPDDGFAIDDIRIQSVLLETTIELTESPEDGAPLFGGVGPALTEITLASNRDGIIGTATTDGSGNWSISDFGIRDGNHVVTVAIFGIPVATEIFRVENNRPPSEINRELVPFESTWKYLDDGSDQYGGATPFFDESYNDASWREGVGRFGYGDDGEITTIEYGSNPSNKPLVTYFRKTFEYEPGATRFERGVLHFYADDGIVVYLNGVELHRFQVGGGAVTNTKPANSQSNNDYERVVQRFEFDASLVRAGENQIAVSVHNRAIANDDLGFDLRLTLSRNWFFSGFAFDVGSYPTPPSGLFEEITTADVNGDGLMDIVYTNDSYPDDTVEYRLNLGNDLLGDGVVIDPDLYNGHKPYIVDLENDGDSDVITFSFGAKRINVFKNDGAGSFSQSQSFGNFYPYGINLGDLDGDGFEDLIYQQYDSGGSYTDRPYGWRRNNRSGVFGSFQEIGRGYSVSALSGLIAADMDGDGDQDVVVTMNPIPNQETDSRISWWENDGDGNFIAEHAAFDYVEFPAVLAEDVDMDGDIDLIVNYWNFNAQRGQIHWYPNDGDGNFGRRWTIEAENYTTRVQFRDIDRDGDPDMLCYHKPFNYQMEWRENDGKGNFSFSERFYIGSFTSSSSPGDIAAADWDGDGYLDILTNTHTGPLGLVQSKNGAGPRITLFEVESNTVEAGGEADFTWITESADEVTLNGEVVASSGSVQRPVGAEDMEFVLVATNADGTSEDKLTVFVPDDVFDSGTIVYAAEFPTMARELIIAAGDLTGDNLPEIVIAHNMAHKLAWLRNEGGGNFSAPIDFPDTFIAPVDLEIADFDGDGLNDIAALSDSHDEYVGVYRNLGNATFAARVDTPVDGAYRIKSEEMNADGRVDLLVWYGTAVKIHLSNSNSNGTFGSGIDVVGSRGAADFEFADLTGDGIRDFVRLSNTFTLFPGLGPLTFSFDDLIPISSGGGYKVHIEDFDGDGILDPWRTSSRQGTFHKERSDGNWEYAGGIGAFEDQNGDQMDNSDSVAGDFDRDGDIDLAFNIYETFDDGAVYWVENDGTGVFSEPQVVAEGLTRAREFVAADVDGDGKTDLLRMGRIYPYYPVEQMAYRIHLYRNISGRAIRPSLTSESDSGGLDSDNVTNNTSPDFAGNATAGSTIVLHSSLDGVLGTATADGSGFWSITGQKLSHGEHLVTISEDGGSASESLIVRIDTIAEVPDELALTEETDSGASSSDSLTQINTPVIYGVGEVGSTVELFSSIDGAIGSGTANSEFWIETEPLSEGEHEISAVATDLAGNISELSEPLMVTVDMTPPDPIDAPILEAASDTGILDDDGITSDATPTFVGSVDAGSPVTLFADGTVIGTAEEGGEWTITSISLADGSYEITVRQSDLAGNMSPPSVGVPLTIDTTPPTLTFGKAVGQDDPASAGPVLFTATFNEDVTGFDEADVTVGGSADGPVSVTGGPAVYTVSVATAASEGTVTASVRASAATDQFGNVSGAPTFGDTSVSLDTHGGDGNSATSLTFSNDSAIAEGFLEPGDTDTFTFTLTDSKQATITTSGSVDTRGALFTDGGSPLNDPVRDSDAGAEENFLIKSALPPGTYDLFVTSEGSAQTGAYSLSIMLDDLPVVINEVDADTSNANTLEFVEIYDGGGGNTALDGMVLVFYRGDTEQSYLAVDLDGQSTDENGFFVLGNASVPNVDLVLADQSLRNGRDAVAIYFGDDTDFPNDTPLTTSGPIDAVVSLPNGEVQNVQLESLLLPGQPHLDEGGNGFREGQSLQRIPDGAGGSRISDQFVPAAPTPGASNHLPLGPGALDLDPESDSGDSNSDDLTNVVRPSFKGPAQYGTLVELSSDLDGVIGTAQTGADGIFVLSATDIDLSEGIHVITPKTVSTGETGPTLTIEIDITAPSAPLNLDLESTSDSGDSNSDNITNDPTPSFSGDAVTGSTVTVFANALNAGTTTASSPWLLTSSLLPDDNYAVTATATDVAGNVSAPSDPLNVVIDTTAPTVSIDLASGQTILASGGPAVFTATFSEAVLGFEIADVAVYGNAAGAASLSGGTSAFDITVETTLAEGSVLIGIPASIAEDAAGNSNEAATMINNRVNLDRDDSPGGSPTAVESGTRPFSSYLSPDDVDTFAFSILAPSYVTVFTTGALDTLGEIRDSADTVLNAPDTDDNAGDGQNFLSLLTLGPGTYTVAVSAKDSHGGDFDLSVEATVLPPPLPSALVDNTLLKSQTNQKLKKLKKAVKKSKKAGNTNKSRKLKKMMKKLKKLLKGL